MWLGCSMRRNGRTISGHGRNDRVARAP
jgi:hypothetical protein